MKSRQRRCETPQSSLCDTDWLVRVWFELRADVYGLHDGYWSITPSHRVSCFNAIKCEAKLKLGCSQASLLVHGLRDLHVGA